MKVIHLFSIGFMALLLFVQGKIAIDHRFGFYDILVLLCELAVVCDIMYLGAMVY